MEPTIYKPSIYKGAGIYKILAAGGGGNNFDFGQSLEAKLMPDGRTWATKNLTLAPFPDGATGYNNDSANIINYGLMMNWTAVQYIVNNKDVFCPGWNVPTKSEFDTLLNSCNRNYSQLNAAGFNIQLCGRKEPDSWDGLGTFGTLWTRTAGGVGHYRAFLQNGLIAVDATWNHSLIALRLIKDE